ncbi:MAG: aspartate kinase, partial [bacterium]
MLIVQKYGGSSLANPNRIKKVARRITRLKKKNNHLVVVVSAMGDTTDELISLSHQITENPHKRELDMLISTGEQISAALLSMAIYNEGFKAVSLTASQVGIRTDNSFTKARIKGIDTVRINKELSEDNIVIVPGFQGITEEDEITTLGRGGSDTTAVALACCLDAESCEIYTDVDGVYTADPRIVPKAKKLDIISYDAMVEMASLGSVVLQTRAVEF